MENTDYQSLKDLKDSYWWKILTDVLDERIKSIEKVLLEPDESDMLQWIDEEKQKNLLNYKKMERKYLISLKELPDSLISTKIKLDTNK